MSRRLIPDLLPGMTDAGRLTRAGKLTEATALLQQMLRGQAEAVDGEDQGDVIDASYTVLEPAPEVNPVRKSRQPLAETLARIARGNMPAPSSEPDDRRQGKPKPDAVMTTHIWSGPAGSRDYMLFVPPNPTADPMPVVVMLHGCTQSPEDFARGTGMNALAAAQGVIVVYPGQPGSANMNKCWNWFRTTDQGRDGGEPAILAAITREVLALLHADPARVYVAGLSAGGAAAAILGQTHPDLFAAIGVHSGLAAGAAQDVASAFAAMRNGAKGVAGQQPVPTIVFHGKADATVHVGNAAAVALQSRTGRTSRPTVTRGNSAGGRAFECRVNTLPDGRSQTEVWLIDGAGHAWAGGHASGSHTDPAGPDASAEMLRFFDQHRLR